MSFINFINGFRKFSIMLIVILVACAFRVLGYITGQEFVGILTPVAVAFMGTNALEHMTKTISEWVKAKATKEITNE